jgi:PDZ domain-containing protein
MYTGEFDLPEPQGVRPVKGPRLWRWIIAGAILIGLTAAALYIPIPAFYAYLPGPVRNVEQLVDVSGRHTYSSEGDLYLTTVNVDLSVTFAEWVKDSFDKTAAVVKREQVTGGGSFSDLEKEELKAMDESKQHAQEVALSALGISSPTADGSRIQQFLDNANAAKDLKVGDVITKIDGTPVKTSCEVGSVIAGHQPGDTVAVTVRRGKVQRTYEIQTIADPLDPTAAIIGVGLHDIHYRFDPGMKVKFKTGRIAGPSAGLMFTLGLYDQLTPDDLTHGKKIAGTGTISCNGRVGPIGGIEQKIAGAEAAGAEIFLSPQANYDAAKAVAGDIQVVPISTFDDALKFLQALG